MDAALEVICPSCGARYQIASDKLGRTVACRSCQHSFLLKIDKEAGETTSRDDLAETRQSLPPSRTKSGPIPAKRADVNTQSSPKAVKGSVNVAGKSNPLSDGEKLSSRSGSLAVVPEDRFEILEELGAGA